MPLRVVIADDEVLARQKLLQLLRDDPDVEVVGEGANALETIDLVQFTQPDVLLLDVRMPGMDGFDVISALSSSRPPWPSQHYLYHRARPIRAARPLRCTRSTIC